MDFPRHVSAIGCTGGAANGPILPEHFWGPVVTEAMAFIDGVSSPADVDCAAEDLAEADQAALAARELSMKC